VGNCPPYRDGATSHNNKELERRFTMLSFSFVPTKNDYLKAIWTYYFSNSIILVGLIFLVLLVPLVILSVILLVALKSEVGTWLPITAIFILGSGFFAFVLLINPLITANKVKNNERLNSPVQFEVSGDQLLIKNQFTETKLDWGSFQKVIETKDYFLLVHSVNKNMFQIVPKRAFSSSADEQTFRNLLTIKIPKWQNSTLNIKKNPIIVITLIGVPAMCLLFCILVLIFYYVISLSR
jgi:hypothetical protein